MKNIKKKIAVVLVLAMAMVTGLTGCGDSYEKQTVTLTGEGGETYWELTVTSDEVVFDEGRSHDNLIIYVTAKNTSEETEKLSSDVIADGVQNGESLDAGAQIEGNYEIMSSEVAPGESVDVAYTFQLEDYSQVDVNFHGYTSYVTGGTATFSVEGRQTEECKAAQEAEEAKKDAKSFDIGYISGEIADGWYIDEVDDDSVKINQDKEDGGYLEIISVFSETAKDAAEEAKGIYTDAEVSVKTIAGTEYQCVKINDSQFELYAKSGTGEVFQIYGMFVDLDSAMDQLEKISIN